MDILGKNGEYQYVSPIMVYFSMKRLKLVLNNILNNIRLGNRIILNEMGYMF